MLRTIPGRLNTPLVVIAHISTCQDPTGPSGSLIRIKSPPTQIYCQVSSLSYTVQYYQYQYRSIQYTQCKGDSGELQTVSTTDTKISSKKTAPLHGLGGWGQGGTHGVEASSKNLRPVK